MAVRIQKADPTFKPLRDAVHNQLSASLIAPLEAYAATLAPGETRNQVDALIAEIGKLTAVDERALAGQVHGIENAQLRDELHALLPSANTDAIDAIVMLAQLMVLARQHVAAGGESPSDARRLIDLDVTVSADLQRRGSALLDDRTPLTARKGVRLLAALTDAAYGVGLLTAREREAAAGHCAPSRHAQAGARCIRPSQGCRTGGRGAQGNDARLRRGRDAVAVRPG